MDLHPQTSLGSTNTFAAGLLAAKRIGRPPVADPASERSRKPWLGQGISQRTYYRRKAVAAAEAPPPPEQHGAHVAAWFATLGPIPRLEYKSFMRWCQLGIWPPLPRATRVLH